MLKKNAYQLPPPRPGVIQKIQWHGFAFRVSGGRWGLKTQGSRDGGLNPFLSYKLMVEEIPAKRAWDMVKACKS